MICEKCGTEIDENGRFCPFCGSEISSGAGENDDYANVSPNPLDNGMSNVIDVDSDNSASGFYQALKDDLKKSESLNIAKDQANKATGKLNELIEKLKQADGRTKKIIAGVTGTLVLLVVVLSIVTNIHVCEDCGKRYVGKVYHVGGIFSEYNLCKDCRDEFYSIF